MADQDLNETTLPTSEANEFADCDEVAELVAALGALARKTTIPVVRACLEEASEAILYLTSSGPATDETDGASAAA